jgi:hypothetical protein
MSSGRTSFLWVTLLKKEVHRQKVIDQMSAIVARKQSNSVDGLPME